MDKDTVMNISQTYAEKVRPEFNPTAVYLFGSYAKGNAREYSDIDIAVIVKNFKGDWGDATTRLQTLCRGVSSDIEPHLIDDDGDDPSGFLGEVLRTGIPL